MKKNSNTKSILLIICLICVFNTAKAELIFQNPQVANYQENVAICQVSESSDSRLVEFDQTYNITSHGFISKLEFKVALPQSYDHRQIVHKINYSTRPRMTYQEEQAKYAVFVFENPHHTIELNINFQIEVLAYDLSKAQDLSPTVKTLKKGKRKKYLRLEDYLKIENQNSIPWEQLEQDSALKVVYEIHEFVEQTLHYQSEFGKDRGADFALTTGAGDCSEYSDLMVALCRYKGIPARTVSGYTVKTNKNSIYGNIFQSSSHAWVEVFFEDYGWIPFDPTHSDGSQVTQFNHLQTKYIYLYFNKLDRKYTWKWWGDGRVNVKAILNYKDVEANVK